MYQFNKKDDFEIRCKKCNSTSVEFYAVGGGCDSCGYGGGDINFSCNNCHNLQVISD